MLRHPDFKPGLSDHWAPDRTCCSHPWWKHAPRAAERRRNDAYQINESQQHQQSWWLTQTLPVNSFVATL